MTVQDTVELTQEGTSRWVQTKDWSIHYQEAGSGHPLILIHGSGPGASGWSNFSPNIGPLAERFRVLAIDVPGWGDSDSATPEQADSVGALVQFMDELGIERAALVGNSMGGIIATSLAAAHPERVSHLVTMGTGSFPTPTLFGAAGPSEGIKVLVAGYRDPSPETMRRLADVMTFDPGFATEEMVAKRAEAAARRDDHRANFLAGFGQPGYMPFATPEQVASITAPTLLIHGRDDRVVHFEHSLRLCSLIRNSRLYLLNRCGHWAQLEHAAEFNRVVADFVGTGA
ncbi:alpha/beta fold hydrolase [Arthrobacter ginkgonis]|uniref:Alpha/beta fold hydrolase n=1 Tax=Arthrobacter ginkgonis TaxID=1630594 RepID=A0ABP7CKN8_9MICC